MKAKFMLRYSAFVISLSLAVFSPVLATPVSFSFASASSGTADPGGLINFSGGAVNAGGATSTFNFVNATGKNYSFGITSAAGEGSLVGLFGQITGTWMIGAVSRRGMTDTASVTAVDQGTIRIYQDAADPSTFVEAQINFFTIQTIFTGAVGGVSGSGSLNVSGWNTSGTITNSSLNDLISENWGTSSISFTFSPKQTLTELVTAATPQSTSFSGTLATQAMAEPTEFASLGADLSVLGALLFLLRRRIIR